METSELTEESPIRSSFTVDDLDIEILPLIYDILRSVEKDPHDTTQKAKESQDTSHKILELQKKLDSARAQIKRLPGIEYSKEEQLQKLETLRKQLRLKRELLLKYRNMCTFEQLINKLADSKPIRQSAKLVVYLFSQTGKINNVYKLKSPAEALQILKNFANNMKNELKQVREKKK
ncbi:hypothetical protein HZH66_007264 [Vespula vulgaris]|uniref:Mediator of RNA polymerase II transcription subunit 9 n=2 Tax=Vespula TaxID=7451 RepID=A0A834P0C9_VESPE|nr:hypothetical protein HZH66_007264 [Vespula vulgaris]KAF7423406.1 hypothetical protein H0235_008689 [Vespula pensylvanica]